MYFNFDADRRQPARAATLARRAVRSGLTLAIFGLGGLVLFELALFASDYLHVLNG